MIKCGSIVLLGILLRWGVSLFPYSGAGVSPMYGDYEAQRHWQEITVNLPISEWYSNTANNDLLYWGLDYPPLTAYHSYICGKIAKVINPAFVALHSSRGFESPAHKLFMRYSVLIIDLLIYIPACYLFSTAISKSSVIYKNSCFMSLILYPGLYLIDYGHFQYNNFSLGLFIFAVSCFLLDYDCFGAMFFSLALNYKQMELYHALPIFCYLLGKCLKENYFCQKIFKLMQIGFTVILTFAVCWAPFLTDTDVLRQVITRVFPINRGLYEDKVANFWCSISIFFKFKQIFNTSQMALICLATTALCLLPSCIQLLVIPTRSCFRYALVNCAMIFFLFSYHVHEKSILLVIIPACFVFNEEPLMVMWFSITSILSMFPLLIRDGLLIPSLSFTVLLFAFSLFVRDSGINSLSKRWECQYFFNTSILSLLSLTIFSLIFPPPNAYPDLFPVLISIFSCGLFFFICFYFHYCQFNVGIHRGNNITIKYKSNSKKKKYK